MWLSMDAVLVMSVSIIFDYHVSLQSSQHSTQFLCLTMRLIDIITYFSKYLASLIYFPTNWILITMWLSMEAVLVSSVSIVFRDHVSLNLANILHNFCDSQWGSSIVLHTFQGISHHWLISLQIGDTLPCGSPWMQILFRQCPLFSIIMCP